VFGLGVTEILLILVVALLVLGPKRLPEAARSLGRGLAEFRRASGELRGALSLEGPPDAAPVGATAAARGKPLETGGQDGDRPKSSDPGAPAATDPQPKDRDSASPTASAPPAEPEIGSAADADRAADALGTESAPAGTDPNAPRTDPR
jgi:TatA/E family protein of Tat protein translocase